MSFSLESRQNVLASAKRVVIKVGTRLLGGDDGTREEERIQQLVAELARVRERYDVVLVSSGAIGAGMAQLQIKKRPRDLPRLQALAAVGQCRLMSVYESACKEHGFHCAQVLLSADDIRVRHRHLNMCNCIYDLLDRRILPVINENDAVSVEEIRFGDNDTLAVQLATMIRADVTIILTTVDGLRTRTVSGELGERISMVDRIDERIRELAMGTDGNPFSIGGMATKIQAAEMSMAAGEPLWIANGEDFSVIHDILDGKDVGTLFVPVADRLAKSKRWLAFFTEPVGSLSVDAGAARAVSERGKSLLPSGITSVEGDFAKGDTVRIVDAEGAQLALGISNYAASDLTSICGLRSDGIRELLGPNSYDEAIHRDNMVVSPGT